MFTKPRTRKFFHNFLSFEELETTTIDGKRHYITPGGTFLSVTSVLGEKLSKDGLIAWRNRVGEAEANKVSTQASRRGSAIHSLAEKYLLNEENWDRGAMPVNIDTFSRIKPLLDKNIGSVYGIEVPVWSSKLKTAGRVDLLAGWQGFNSIIDFKTSKRIKTEEQILSYFLQATAYSLCARELNPKLDFKKIVIIIAVDHEDTQVFVKDRDEYVDRVMEIFT